MNFNFCIVNKGETKSALISLGPSHMMSPLGQKFKRKEDPIDRLLIESFKVMKEKQTKSTKGAEACLPSGPYYDFGSMELAWQLFKMSEHQVSITKVRIHHILLDIYII